MGLLNPWRAEVKSPKVKVYAVGVLEPTDASPTDGIVAKWADGSTMVIEDRTNEDHFGEAAPGKEAREHEAPKKKKNKDKKKGLWSGFHVSTGSSISVRWRKSRTWQVTIYEGSKQVCALKTEHLNLDEKSAEKGMVNIAKQYAGNRIQKEKLKEIRDQHSWKVIGGEIDDVPKRPRSPRTSRSGRLHISLTLKHSQKKHLRRRRTKK